ncbi:MAG: hypothetical protein HYS13_10785 [Planctomycetia bacterium]|nr:hypothetical protein [Planctomycetia bacterium]
MIDPAGLKSKAVFKHEGKYLSLAGDLPAGKLFAGSTDTAIHVIEPAAEKKEPAAKWTGHDNYVSALVLAPRPGGAVLVSGGYDERLIWRKPDSGEIIRTIEDAHGGWIRDLAATPDGSLVVSCGDDMKVKIWDADEGSVVHTLEGHATRTPQDHVTALYALAVSPDGKHVASGDRVGEVRVWEVESGSLVTKFDVPVLYTYDPRQRKRSIGGIRSLCFSRDGSLLAVGGIGQIENVDGLAGPATVEVWNWRGPRKIATLGADGHKAMINALALDADAAWLIGAGGGGDNALLAFWKMEPILDKAAAGSEAASDSEKEKPEEGKKKAEAPLSAAHKYKFDGHVHRFLLNEAAGELYAAGHQKLEVWACS